MNDQTPLSPEARDALGTVLQVVRIAAQSEMDPYMSNHVDGFLVALAGVDPPLRVIEAQPAPLDERYRALVAAARDVRCILDQHIIRLARYGYPGSAHTETFAREAVAILDAALEDSND